MRRALSVEELRAKGSMEDSSQLRLLFHQLNNQLGIILANAELLETKATDPSMRARAAQIVASTLEAMNTAKDIRIRVSDSPDRS